MAPIKLPWKGHRWASRLPGLFLNGLVEGADGGSLGLVPILELLAQYQAGG